jgi:hypothetical protein
MRILAALAISLCMLASGAHSQTSKDQGAIRIMRSGSQPSRQGPAENFTGSVRVDPFFQANAPARIRLPRHVRVWRAHRVAHAPARSNPYRDGGHGARAALG